MPDAKATGARVEKRRRALGLSRAQLAEQLNTSRMRIWRVETGKTQLRADGLREFSRVLRVKPSELLA